MRSFPHKHLQQGFTLLELMIVTAIIGILTSLAVPSYQAYVYRAKAAEVVLAMDKIHTLLAALQAESSAPMGKSIRIVPNVDTTTYPADYPLLYCVYPAGTTRCQALRPLVGLGKPDLTFTHLGVTLNVGSGADPFSQKEGQYKISVNEDHFLTRNNPALSASARQTILAVHALMKPFTYRDVLRINTRSDSSVYLYMNLGGKRP